MIHMKVGLAILLNWMMVLTSINPAPIQFFLEFSQKSLPSVQVFAGGAAMIFSCMMIVIKWPEFKQRIKRKKKK